MSTSSTDSHGLRSAEAIPLRRIATEEAFTTPEVAAATEAVTTGPGATGEPGIAALGSSILRRTLMEWGKQLLDFGDNRRKCMAEAGIDTQILGLTTPGVQISPSEQGVELARKTNDFIAAQCRRDPARYAALATIAPQAPRRA